MTNDQTFVRPPLMHPNVQSTLMLIVLLCFAFQILSKIHHIGNKDTATTVNHDSMSVKIDLNHARKRELALLPNVGPVLAKRIVNDRETKGPYRNVSDLQRVHGIGPKTIDRISKNCFVNSIPDASP